MAGTDPIAPLTPQQRLAISRRALVRQLHGEEEPPPAPWRLDLEAGDNVSGDTYQPGVSAPASEGTPAGPTVLVSVVQGIARRWWRRHPAHAVGQMARPVLAHYARKEPAKLMAVAAATGAALVLVRPWRLLSATAVLAAVLKTSDLADVVNTLMQKTPSPPRKDMP